MVEEKKPIIKGEQNPHTSEQKQLTKADILFDIDTDGQAIPQKVEVDIYDPVLDNEIILSTLELDNALIMYDSIRESFKKKKQHLILEIDKLRAKSTPESKKELSEKESKFEAFADQTDMKLEAYKKKIKESRSDLLELEKVRDSEKETRIIEVVPCFVAEAYHYFDKKEWKSQDWTESNNKWESPKGGDDLTYISHLLSDKVVSPKMTVIEWDKAKPALRMKIKDKIAEISYYQRPSPKEILVENRRSEALKNIIGDSEEKQR